MAYPEPDPLSILSLSYYYPTLTLRLPCVFDRFIYRFVLKLVGSIEHFASRQIAAIFGNLYQPLQWIILLYDFLTS